eukprot:5010711-Prymnesium_polylepis.1
MQLQHKSTQRAVSEHERAVAGTDPAAQPPLQHPMVVGMQPGAMQHSGGVYSSSSSALSIGGQLGSQYSST